MMYRHNRVKYIKKKFESSFSEENKTLPSKPVIYKTEVFQEFNDSSMDTMTFQKKAHATTDTTNAKSSVKRTPAFRREKMESRETQVNNLTSSKRDKSCSSCDKEIESKNCEWMWSEDSGIFMNSDLKYIQTSKSETNFHKFYDKSNEIISHLFSNEDNILDVNKDDKNKESEKQLNQFQVYERDLEVNTKKQKEIGLEFSESIRRALESPLPKGPPPKKPPRTFCHNSQISNQSSVKSKTLNTGIPVLKSKLEKLEKVIKAHELGTHNINHKQNFEYDLSINSTQNSLIGAKKIALKGSNKKIENLSSCLQLSSCLSRSVDEKLVTKKSENYLGSEPFNSELSDHVVCEVNKTTINAEIKLKDVFLKAKSLEPIYDVPCVKKNKNFKTFGKHDDNQTTLELQEAGGLHYMCTDVVNSANKSPYPTIISRRKSLDDERWAEGFNLKSKFSNDALKRVSSSMSRIENDDEQIIEPFKNLIVRKNDHNEDVEKEIGTLKSAVFYYSSTETDSDSMSIMGGIRYPLKFSTKKEFNNAESERKAKTVNIENFSIVKSKNNNDEYINSCSTHLFESCLLVGLTLCESKENVPYIKSVFPPHVKPPPYIESLCFPDASYWPFISESHEPEEQYYSLVITNQSGCRKFGYCRRVLPEGGHYCLPLTYCIISPHKANGFYYKVLQELESRHGSPGIEDFIQRLYNCQFPGPGGKLKLMEIFEKATQITLSKKDDYLSTTLVRRPCDVRLEEKDLTQLLGYLQISVLLKVFSSLLHERKILLLSSSLRKLSTCSEALHSILIPFSWKHTYIPVLPVHLIEMCDAPTPYVIGLLKHKNFEQLMANINFEDGILVDLDDSKVIKCCGDEESILPSKLVKDLKTSLNLAVISTNLSDTNRNVLISDAFIQFFVQVCGNYSKFIIKLSNGKKIFEKGEFIKSSSSNSTQAFLEWFTETSMFSSFIQEMLHENVEDIPVKLFRLRATEYSEAIRNSTVLRKNCKVINRRVRTLGDKIKDLTSFTK